MTIPPILNKGDTIAILSTARKVTATELQPFLDELKAWQLKPLLGKTIGAQDNQFAGNDALRTQDFQEMLDNPEVKAIWCARGGYGTVRMVDGLDWTTFRQHPKWIIGYSDITVLHNTIHNLGIASLHAQMGLELEKKTEATRQSIRDVLFGNDYTIKHTSGFKFYRTGTATGELVGGNLSVLYSLLGSPSAIDTKGKILFLEDLDEYLYHIDRMMQNLKRNGLLSGLNGLIVGGMTQMNDNTIPFGKTAEEIVWEAVKEYNYPVCFNFHAGHVEDNRALVLGKGAVLSVSAKRVTLSFRRSGD
ncbi:S66 peptidase family protein [Marinirhabdus gelatinilytica]|uniref:Muramoyltetrapeptide carboxypeptidase n=1 Tax=Marinirhabdus gelatinilytica TaxID=1703343 RepID=A0A370QIR6_9FLAO|nr:LD-carboxypeptidase [Marinirhabdus gelatinilytica]RDK88257.1 muramoyltetrapeptide carboxypeptidase [Marinirhabdus gelatinilytica]